jgi:hypothetical protein
LRRRIPTPEEIVPSKVDAKIEWCFTHASPKENTHKKRRDEGSSKVGLIGI